MLSIDGSPTLTGVTADNEITLVLMLLGDGVSYMTRVAENKAGIDVDNVLVALLLLLVLERPAECGDENDAWNPDGALVA